MKVYVASSWRNLLQEGIVFTLREKGLDVYNFREPARGVRGFNWSEIDDLWERWSPDQFRQAILDPIAQEGFGRDFAAMQAADVCVLVLPCGRSAHLEAGWFVGAGKPLHILIIEPCEPELMYLFGRIHTQMDSLFKALGVS